jgi:hypothetical protein
VALAQLFKPEETDIPDLPLWKRFAGEVAYIASPALGIALHQRLVEEQSKINQERLRLKDDRP